MTAHNTLLGQFDLVGIPPAPRGLPQIEVTFDIDANGIVNVSARDKASGKQQQIRIEASGGLTEADIERMVREAEAHAEEDRRRKELVEARNQADAAVYATEKAAKEAGDRLPGDLKSEIEQAVAALKSAIAGENLQAIRQAMQRLAQADQRLSEALAQPQQSSPGSAPESSEGDVVDAEFEEVDKRDRAAG